MYITPIRFTSRHLKLGLGMVSEDITIVALGLEEGTYLGGSSASRFFGS